MLTDTRGAAGHYEIPRPPGVAANHALGNLLIAALAAEGVGALVDETCPPPCDDGRRGLPARSAASWPAGRTDL